MEDDHGRIDCRRGPTGWQIAISIASVCATIAGSVVVFAFWLGSLLASFDAKWELRDARWELRIEALNVRIEKLETKLQEENDRLRKLIADSIGE